MPVEDAADTPAITAFVQHVLIPTLKPGQVVVMDNLAPHKAPKVRTLIEATACRLLLLPLRRRLAPDVLPSLSLEVIAIAPDDGQRSCRASQGSSAKCAVNPGTLHVCIGGGSIVPFGLLPGWPDEESDLSSSSNQIL